MLLLLLLHFIVLGGHTGHKTKWIGYIYGGLEADMQSGVAWG
jgi:hypothetical protein